MKKTETMYYCVNSNGFYYTTLQFLRRESIAEMYRDYARAKRVYFDKASGNFLSEENFHASDYQKKIDFEAREEELRLEDIERNKQIEENNQAGDHAEGGYTINGVDSDKFYKKIDKVIIDKKLGRDKHGNLTDINPVSQEDDSLPDDDKLFKDIE